MNYINNLGAEEDLPFFLDEVLNDVILSEGGYLIISILIPVLENYNVVYV